MLDKPIYDITDSENALETLVRLTDLKKEYWEHYIWETKMLSDDSWKSFQKIVERFDIHPTFDTDNLICHLQHITTSADGCKHIKNKGLRDLRITYEDTESELRRFLDEQGVKIDIPNARLYFNNEDIGSIEYSYNNFSNDYHSKTHRMWSVGRKFYYDFCVCGWFSFDHTDPYGGNVHERPEILFNISEAIGKRIDKIWKDTHKCYVIKFTTEYNNICKDIRGDERIDLLYRAFYVATYEPDERDALLKDGIFIPPENIISTERFDFK